VFVSLRFLSLAAILCRCLIIFLSISVKIMAEVRFRVKNEMVASVHHFGHVWLELMQIQGF